MLAAKGITADNLCLQPEREGVWWHFSKNTSCHAHNQQMWFAHFQTAAFFKELNYESWPIPCPSTPGEISPLREKLYSVNTIGSSFFQAYMHHCFSYLARLQRHSSEERMEYNVTKYWVIVKTAVFPLNQRSGSPFRLQEMCLWVKPYCWCVYFIALTATRLWFYLLYVL